MSEIATGIDIGTHHVKVVIAEASPDPRMLPRILGTGYAQSIGIKRGYITSIEDASRSVAAATNQAAKAARIKKIRRAIIGVGGEGLYEMQSRAEVVVERGDNEVTARDIDRVRAASEASIPPALLQNRRIIEKIALRFMLDGNRFLGKNPAGLKAARLGVESLFIAAEKKHVNDMVEALGMAGIEVEDIAASPLAASFATLGSQQKRAGVGLLDIGAETSTLMVFDDDLPVSTLVLPWGSDDVSSDIALALRIPLEEASQLARGAVLGSSFSQKKIDDAIEKRLAIIFRAVDTHLKKLGKNELLPAGIMLTGGGSSLAMAPAVAQKIMKLPARVATIQASDAGRGILKDGSWAVAYGLTVWGVGNRDEYSLENDRSTFGEFFGSAWRMVKKFLP